MGASDAVLRMAGGRGDGSNVEPDRAGLPSRGTMLEAISLANYKRKRI